MNETSTQRLEILIGTLATGLIVLVMAAYMLIEPSRVESARQAILQIELNDAMTLYAENCAVCHGLQGEGIGSIPALNRDALRTMDASELTKTIARGRFNTAMPAWSQEDGGPFSDYQVDEMVKLIQYGDWNATQDRVVNLGLAPLVPFSTEPDPALLEQVASLPDGAVLQTAITIFARECVSCHGADGLGSGIAPALNDPAVREKTTDELTRTVTFGAAGTLMAGWRNALTPEEIAAMVTLVQRWNEIPGGTIPAPDVPIATTIESIALGSQLFTANCSTCHGPDGQGTQRAPSLNVKSFLVNTNDQAIQQIVTNGVPGTAMPAWGTRMGEADIQSIVGFIRQWEPTAPEVASPVRSAGGPPWARTTVTSNTTTTVTANPQSAGTAATGTSHTATGAGGPPWAQATAPTTNPLDWRILTSITLLLAIAFSLIAAGLTGLKQQRQS